MPKRTLSPPLFKILLLFLIITASRGVFTPNLFADDPAPQNLTISNYNLDVLEWRSIIEIPILISNSDPDFEMAAFFLTIGFDPSELAFMGAEPGSAIAAKNWEEFRINFSQNYDQFHLRIMAEDYNNPSLTGVEPLGLLDNDTLAILRFYVFLPEENNCTDYNIDFKWDYCTDNSAADSTIWRNYRIARDVYDFKGNVITAEDNLPTLYGPPDSCLPDSSEFWYSERGIDFQSARVIYECPYFIDRRGDVNLNDIQLEIADFVLFQNFMLEGADVFIKDYDLQLATTDVNSDGLPGSVADLVFMWLVMAGEYPLYGNPLAEIDSVHYIQDLSAQSVSMTASDSPAAVYLVFSGNIIPTGSIKDNAGIQYEYQDDTTRVLFYTPGNIADNFVIGDGLLFEYTGSGRLVRSDAANNYRSYYASTFEIINPEYTCGDVNADGQVNISDPLFLINYIFLGGFGPIPWEAGEVNCDGSVNMADIIYIINYVFRGGTPPCDTNGDGSPDC